MENSNDTIGNRNHDLPANSTTTITTTTTTTTTTITTTATTTTTTTASTTVQFSLGSSSPYTSTDRTSNIHNKGNNTKTQYKQYKTQ